MNENNIDFTCCFFGHRKIEVTQELKTKLKTEIEKLITENKVDTFLFGSNSLFNSLCLEVVTELKIKFPHINRFYIRAEYPYISEHYKEYLLEDYEETYFPERLLNSGKAVYVERNYEMIDKSCYCIVYLDEKFAPTKRKSGTKIALDYAKKKKRVIIGNF